MGFGRFRMMASGAAAVLLVGVLAACVPSFPAGATLSAVPEGAFVRLSWPAASHDEDKTIASYRVDVDGAEVSRVAGTATTCLLKGLANGSSHQVAVTAYDTAGQWSGTRDSNAAVTGTVIAPGSGDPGTEVVCDGPTGSVSGHVLRDSDGAPVEQATVWFWGEHGAMAWTDSDGVFSIDGMVPGTYDVSFAAPEYLNLVQEFYGDSLLRSSGQTIVIEAGKETSGVNASLAPGASISGTIRPDTIGAPGTRVCVSATDFAVWDFGGGWCMDDWGAFVINGLPAGNYRLSFYGDGVADEYWKDSATYVAATPIPVISEGSITGIDARVGP